MGLDKPQTKTIEGHAWVVTPFPGRPANKYKTRLLKMIGPALAELLPAIGSLSDAAEGNVNEADMVAAIPKVIASLAQHVDEDLLVNTMVELMAMSTRDGVTVTGEVFDIEFAGNDLELYQVLWFILQVNYPDFIEWVVGRLTGRHPKASEPATQQTPTPTGATSKE